MAVDIPAIREIVERVCTRQDVLDACKRRDLGFVITALCAHGLVQAQIGVLTGKTQGRISEYKTYKRIPNDISIFEDFADGLGMPAVARRALGLAPEPSGSGASSQTGGRSADIAGASSGDVQPLLSNLSKASAVPVLGLGEQAEGPRQLDRQLNPGRRHRMAGPEVIAGQPPIPGHVQRAGHPLTLQAIRTRKA